MASKWGSVSKSVALSLAALLVLTGAMFLITTLETDHQEWVLVEDQVIDLYGLSNLNNVPSVDPTNYEDIVLDFDEETSTYSISIPANTYSKSSGQFDVYAINVTEDFDASKNYKFVITSEVIFDGFGLFPSSYPLFVLKNIVAEDGVYVANVILLDQYVTDFTFNPIWFSVKGVSNSSYLIENDLTIQVYELQDDNAGSVAAAVTGLVLIVFGVFATPMLQVFRRR